MLRLGLSEEILQYLDKPEDYKIVNINEESPEVSENIDTNLVNNTLVSLKYPHRSCTPLCAVNIQNKITSGC